MIKHLTILAVASVISGCGEAVRNCAISENYAAQNSGIDVDVEPPFRCDYTVYAENRDVSFEIHYNAPDVWYAGRQTVHSMFARIIGGWLPVGDAVTFFWRSGPECDGSPACLGLLVTYRAATGTPDFGKYTDQYRAAGATPIGDALFEMTITGRIGGHAGVGGPIAMPAASTGHWTADVDWDTLSYQYQWYVDGVPISGATQRSLTRTFYGESGQQYVIRADATMMDGTTLTRTKTVTLQMIVGWSGPPSIEAGQPGSWYATATGARMPLTSCEWWVDYSMVEASSCTLNYAFPSTGSYVLTVIATDSRGISESSPALGVQVTTPGCHPPECYESLKAAPERRLPTRPRPSRGLGPRS